MTAPATTRRFTLQFAQIAQLIADPRALSYEQIGAMLTPRLAEKTVKVYVQRMTEFFDADSRDAHPPRVQVLVWVRHLHWELRRAPTIEEIVERSAQRDV